MNIFGIGTDIINIKRLEKAFKKNNSTIKSKIFSENEIKYCEKKKNSISFFAKRFAAKEALSKALGTGIRGKVSFKNIEITNNSFGKPSIKLKGSTAKFLINKIKKKKYFIYLSLSDDDPWAQATVIITY
jgi:holo-[acyl-carrier protein] synthase|tara:strand:+ start:225 stop:614 length:390 start_codon:yes stop_codon:yes gene_type:complete